jgi:hypothetical protein
MFSIRRRILVAAVAALAASGFAAGSAHADVARRPSHHAKVAANQPVGSVPLVIPDDVRQQMVDLIAAGTPFTARPVTWTIGNGGTSGGPGLVPLAGHGSCGGARPGHCTYMFTGTYNPATSSVDLTFTQWNF